VPIPDSNQTNGVGLVDWAGSAASAARTILRVLAAGGESADTVS